eukprot:6207369-Pleurochrysis_carterae.AAC.1
MAAFRNVQGASDDLKEMRLREVSFRQIAISSFNLVHSAAARSAQVVGSSRSYQATKDLEPRTVRVCRACAIHFHMQRYVLACILISRLFFILMMVWLDKKG